jgi:hypothetical protein
LELFKKHSRLKLLTNSTSEIGCWWVTWRKYEMAESRPK